MDFNQEVLKLLRSNPRFKKAVCDLLFDVFETLDDARFNKAQFLSKFSKRERSDKNSSIDTIRKVMKTRIQQLLQKTLEESENGRPSLEMPKTKFIKDEPVIRQKEEPDFPLRTTADLEAGGYKTHYRPNTKVDHEQSNRADDLMKMDFAHYQPMHRCPKCKGTNLFNSFLQEYVECVDCDSLVLREQLVTD